MIFYPASHKKSFLCSDPLG